MVPGGVTEIIWHFAGYFHYIDDVFKDRFVYENGGVSIRPNDYVLKLKEFYAKADLEDFETDRIPHQTQATAETLRELNFKGPGPGPFRLAEETDYDEGGPGRSPLLPRKTLLESPAPLLGPPSIKVTYQDGGEQQLLDITQINKMGDDDQLLVPEIDATCLHHFDIDATLQGLVAGADEQIPDSLALPQTGITAAIEFFAARDAGTAENGSDAGEHSVGPGRYVNGVLQAEPEPPAEEEAPEEPVLPDLAAKGQWAMLGGNDATNAALIADFKEATNTMIVLGDFFKTNAIVQSNSYIDSDQIDIAGALTQSVIGNANTADNIAEFRQEAGPFAGLEGVFAGLHWNVNIVEGDFYDINLVWQKNVLQDNDVAVQETQHSHYEAHLGENEQLNLTSLYNGEIKYDLIIVEGNFHGANWIFQNNILLDSDILKITAGGDAADATSQSAFSGENKLLNDATIITYGDDTFAKPNEDIDSLVTALADGTTSLDTSFGWFVPGNGSGMLNVLFVKGDYYDINVIWQTNIISDVDTAIQYLGSKPPQEIAGDGSLTQSASTGGNLLTNEAVIVDVGATSSYVSGDVYQDTILIQGNLVAEQNDKIVYGDPMALVSEIVAFTGDDIQQQDDITDARTPVVPDDTMGSIMT